jgi:hypothetical protein
VFDACPKIPEPPPEVPPPKVKGGFDMAGRGIAGSAEDRSEVEESDWVGELGAAMIY